MPKGQLPSELESVRSAAAHAVAPITPAGPDTHSEQDFVFKARRTNAGRSLPPYYLVYFLLVDLLGFRDLGKWEKVAWSIPIDFRGQLFLVDHRKFGVGVFAVDSETSEEAAKEIVACIHRGVSVARPVTPSHVRDFRGAMAGRADKGILLTTGTFTAEARREASRDGVHPIELIDGEKLIDMLEKLELGLQPVRTYEVNFGFFKEFEG